MSNHSNDAERRRQNHPIEAGQVWRKMDPSGNTERLVVGVPDFHPYHGKHIAYIQTHVGSSGYRNVRADVQLVTHAWFRQWIGRGPHGAELISPTTARGGLPQSQTQADQFDGATAPDQP
jgi:hypothetical protein